MLVNLSLSLSWGGEGKGQHLLYITRLALNLRRHTHLSVSQELGLQCIPPHLARLASLTKIQIARVRIF